MTKKYSCPDKNEFRHLEEISSKYIHLRPTYLVVSPAAKNNYEGQKEGPNISDTRHDDTRTRRHE